MYDLISGFIFRGEHDLNKRNKGGWTPLMYACYIGHDSIVHILLDATVNVKVKNLKGHTALHLACSCGNESVVYFLLQVA
jgi:ankyrin repeat protein